MFIELTYNDKWAKKFIINSENITRIDYNLNPTEGATIYIGSDGNNVVKVKESYSEIKDMILRSAGTTLLVEEIEEPKETKKKNLTLT